ncbi:MAG: ankyrin repeat domain-containing protein [Deltaproteobacteria bacterium]|nr:ankyrin repeat domain-containing protein [Deltaproteobacteria bacterium]
MSTHKRMSTLAEASNAGRHEDALTLARDLKRELLADVFTDAALLGWARDYELRSLYHLERFAEGLELLESGEPKPFLISAKNAAWLHSVGAEMAARIGLHDAVLRQGQKAVDLRLDDGDVEGATTAIATMRALFDLVERPDLAERFTTWSERLWTSQEPGGRRAMDSAMAVAQAAKKDWYLAGLPRKEDRMRRWRLREAALIGDAARVRDLLHAGTDPNSIDPRAPGLPTALIQGAYAGHHEVMQALLQARSATSLANVQGRTALHQAADQGHDGIVRLLLEAGADVTAADFCGHTPLHVACWQDHLNVVQELVAAGAPLHRGDINGDSPLALSATERHTRVLEFLLTVDDDLDRANHFGQTALHGAAIAGIAPAVELLLSAGASADLPDRNGMDALAWAQHEGNAEADRVLSRAG